VGISVGSIPLALPCNRASATYVASSNLEKTLGTKNSTLGVEKGGFNRRALEGRQNKRSILEANAMDEKTKETTDQPVLGHIERLVAEEQKLYNQEEHR